MLSKAFRLLSGKLLFGDPEQIRAVNQIATVQTCVDAITGCQHANGLCKECDGSGYLDCECSECGNQHERECAVCRGRGRLRCGICLGGLPEWALAEAFHVLNDGWPVEAMALKRAGA